MNLDLLRKKRAKRIGVKNSASPIAHSGTRRVFFIFDRGTRKFPGDVGLWVRSIQFARSQKAYKKLSKILTNVLRLHPMKSELWIWAARFSMEEHGDMTAARSYMQRGLRFCKRDTEMWLEYTRLELGYLAKIAARRKILGITDIPERQAPPQDIDMDADVVALPRLTGEDMQPDSTRRHEVDEEIIRKLESTSALNGAIPLAIFDAAMQQFQNNSDVAFAFFDLTVQFDELPSLAQILTHIVDDMRRAKTRCWQSQICWLKLPILSLDHTLPEFPAALNVSLRRLKSSLQDTTDIRRLTELAQDWIALLVERPNLDVALQKVLRAQMKSLQVASIVAPD